MRLNKLRSLIRDHFNWEDICLDDEIRIQSNGIIVFLAIALISLIMVIINLVTMTINLLIVTSILCVICTVFGLLSLVCGRKTHRVIMIAASAFVLAMSMYFTYSGGIEGFSIIWLCAFPSVGYIILSRKIARIFNISLLLMVILSLMTPIRHHLGYTYTATFCTRFPVVMAFGSLSAWITEEVRSQTQMRLVRITNTLKDTSRRDPLTGVGNRNAFREDIEYIVEANKTISYTLIDIDFFKNVNDTYGHDAGDIVLKTMAELLSDNIRPGDSVYRWGGEEFIIVMPGVSHENFINALERLRRTVEEADFVIDSDLTIKITISIGGVTCDKDISIEKGIKQADECMYKAKSLGRNRSITRNNIA